MYDGPMEFGLTTLPGLNPVAGRNGRWPCRNPPVTSGYHSFLLERKTGGPLGAQLWLGGKVRWKGDVRVPIGSMAGTLVDLSLPI